MYLERIYPSIQMWLATSYYSVPIRINGKNKKTAVTFGHFLARAGAKG